MGALLFNLCPTANGTAMAYSVNGSIDGMTSMRPQTWNARPTHAIWPASTVQRAHAAHVQTNAFAFAAAASCPHGLIKATILRILLSAGVSRAGART